MTTGQPGPEVICASPADLDALSGVIAAAFHELAPSRWLIADPAARRAIFPGYFRLHVAYALRRGWCTLPPDVTPWRCGSRPGPVPSARWRLPAAAGRRDRALDRPVRRLRPGTRSPPPAGVPHQHLTILAVRPADRAAASARAATARHRDLDHHRTAAYLEASSPRARDLYLRHGYTARPGSAFRLPEGPLLWPMWRQPALGLIYGESLRERRQM